MAARSEELARKRAIFRYRVQIPPDILYLIYIYIYIYIYLYSFFEFAKIEKLIIPSVYFKETTFY